MTDLKCYRCGASPAKMYKIIDQHDELPLCVACHVAGDDSYTIMSLAELAEEALERREKVMEARKLLDEIERDTLDRLENEPLPPFIEGDKVIVPDGIVGYEDAAFEVVMVLPRVVSDECIQIRFPDGVTEWIEPEAIELYQGGAL